MFTAVPRPFWTRIEWRYCREITRISRSVFSKLRVHLPRGLSRPWCLLQAWEVGVRDQPDTRGQQ